MAERELKEIDELLIKNNNKLVADKIIQTLLNIRNVPGISAKRWIWELIQNAKDAYNPRFGSVEIKIQLKEKSIVFSHNGNFFTINNVLGILQQISSKGNSENQTGKFGTGFIGTHLLSNNVIIKGVIYYQKIYRRFEIKLDRSSDSSEKLAEEVSKSINDFRDNMKAGKESRYQIIGEVYNQKTTDFDTSFEYIFNTDEDKEIAQKGLSDLINTAPVTLSNLSDRISKITILDEKEVKTIKAIEYSVESNDDDNNLYIVTIRTNINGREENEEKKYFFSCENEECRLFFQVEQIENGYHAVERNKDQPILLRDFPLIGSENFYFPFFLNGCKFNPLETRSGLYLNGNFDEAKQNRKIIGSAIDLSIKFIDMLLTQNIDKRYLLAYSNIPEPPIK